MRETAYNIPLKLLCQHLCFYCCQYKKLCRNIIATLWDIKYFKEFFRKQGKSQHNDGNFVVEPTRILLLPYVFMYTAKESNSFHEKPGVPFIVKPKNRIYAISLTLIRPTKPRHFFLLPHSHPLFATAAVCCVCVCVRWVANLLRAHSNYGIVKWGN